MRSPLARLRGLAGRPPDEAVAYFPRCRDVHTMTMRFRLDLLFLDGAGRVLEVHRGVRPRSRLRHARAHGVIERFARPGPWFQVGDLVGLPATEGRSPNAHGSLRPVEARPMEVRLESRRYPHRSNVRTRREKLDEALPHV